MGQLAERDPGMTEAEFEAWLDNPDGGAQEAFTGEGLWSLQERNSPEDSEWATLCGENGIYVGSEPMELISMLAEPMICQSCRRQPGQFQCTFCLQVLCGACVSDDPERVVCRYPCQITDTVPAKRPRTLEVPRSARMGAVPVRPQALGSVEEPRGRGTAAAPERSGNVHVEGGLPRIGMLPDVQPEQSPGGGRMA